MFNVWWIIQNLFYALRSPEFNKDMFGCELCGLNSGKHENNTKYSFLRYFIKLKYVLYMWYDITK